ncbi:MAG: AtpZ/AtpI family protein [Rhodobacter sp.]|nr:AtpZ/AtpI family protein [Rhodobacter sp.]
MADPVDKAQMQRLEERIRAAKKTGAPRSKIEEHHSQAHLAWRMVIELVAGIGLGFGIGYGLDVLFGTVPIFLVLFVLLGFVAGVRTMLRTATEVQMDQAGAASATDGGAGPAKDED